ncbi:hypothetical protein JRO89_XS05G0042500 [Xanthoceras sorbifolium]|uniref:EF-hand domain-containing protein n=1 Tax=Xanthoceras sorbifolium TaxID=99658 RepID=A0ABQ8I0E6_9ROSI|nr:hypothetical protein JRO89_XS05G0042500 [Xanthoceras sorbifolium]
MNTFHIIFSNFQLYLQSLLNYLLMFFTKKEAACIQKQKLSDPDDHNISVSDVDDDDVKLSKGDIQFVMGRLGFTDYKGEVYEGFSAKEVTKLFEEKEPSLEEVKQAFDVFDVNKDGFIDEKELQIVLSRLGLISNELGSQIDKCTAIIRAVDANGDGRIDFDEFLTSMYKCFC